MDPLYGAVQLIKAPATHAILDAIVRTLGEDAQLREEAALGGSIRAMSPFSVCAGSPLCPHTKDATAQPRRSGGVRS